MTFEVIPSEEFSMVKLPKELVYKLFDQTVDLNKKVITSVSSKSGK